MGEVWRAEDLRLGEDVALKFLPRGVADNPARRARFLAEAKVARKLTHANLCRVHDYVETDDECFLSMELIEGEDLASLLRRIGRLPGPKALDVAQQICLGIEAAHERGILHRDLKPANVMLDGDGRVRVMDFGLAALVHEVVAAEFAGTPRYMAPEQFRGEVSVKSDIYALGLVLHEIFTGEYPAAEDFSRMSVGGREGVPPEVLAAIAACLNHDPRQRPKSAIAVAAALPGGDPLAATVRAGETPSPAMVAAGVGGRRLSKVIAAVLAVTALLAFGIRAVATRVFSYECGRATWVRPPEALVDRAKDTVRALGYGPAFLHEAAGLDRDPEYDEHLRQTASTTDRWHALGDPVPPGSSLWWRGSTRSLATTFNYFDTTIDDPPPTDGEVFCRVSLAGNLMAFLARPGAPRELSQSRPSLDRAWSDLFTRAGLDLARFREATPTQTPAGAFDVRRAWEGSIPTMPGTLVRVEGASFGDAVVSLHVRWPWNGPDMIPKAGSRGFLWEFQSVFEAGAVVASVIVALRHVAKRRGDLKSAIRFGAFQTVCGSAVWFLATNGFAAQPGWLWLVGLGIGHALFDGVCGAFLYLAIEPFVRRRVPHLLVSWTRLFSGRVGDPLIGRDLLIGGATSILFAVVFAVGCFMETHGASTSLPLARVNPGMTLHGLKAALEEACWYVAWAGRAALLAAGAFAAGLALFRRRWIAVAVTIALGTPICMRTFAFDLVPLRLLVGALLMTSVTVLLLRFGVLAVYAYILLTDPTPITLDPDAWFARMALPFIVMTVVVAMWGWRAARTAAQTRSASLASSTPASA